MYKWPEGTGKIYIFIFDAGAKIRRLCKGWLSGLERRKRVDDVSIRQDYAALNAHIPIPPSALH
jgi:hypothetical protein